jgi:uncharacterized protein YbjT (DUF2867 family)
MESMAFTGGDRVLIAGATGFIGGRLVPELVRKGIRVRLLVRSPEKARGMLPAQGDGEIVRGDLLEDAGLREALGGIHTAYYLVHSMGGKNTFKNVEFAERDKRAARNFMKAAEAEGLKRIIYMGALGKAEEKLSEHLESKAEVGKILSSGSPAATTLRSAIIIGSGGASFEMLRYLVERLPVMVCPRWVNTRIQPIAIRDVLAYLEGCLLAPGTAGQTFDIGGPEVFTYEEMMQEYARARGLARRYIIKVPVLTPLLSSYWVDLVTPVASGVAHPLIEGMVNDVVCRESRIDEYVPITKTSFEEAVRMAFSEEQEGPGVTGW